MTKLVQSLIVIAALGVFAGTAAAESLVLRDFENDSTRSGDWLKDKASKQNLVGDYHGTNSTTDANIEKDKTAVGKQALHVEWDNKDWTGITLPFTTKLYIPADFTGLRFSMRGEGLGQQITIQLFDKRDEEFCATIADDSEDWKIVEIPFTDFQVRGDYQPSTARKDGVLDFPIHSINIESASSGTFDYWLDEIEATK